MARRIILVLGALIICALLFLFAHSNFGFNPNYVVGVIETSTDKFDSVIGYYDKDLNLLYKRKLFMCNMTCFGDCFLDLGEKKYMLSRGTYWIPCRDATELDSNTGKIKKYNIGIAHNLAMSANDKYILTTYSAFDSTINRCEKRTGELKNMTISGSCRGMCVDDYNILYAFGGDSHRLISNLYIIDVEKMEILKTFDIKDRGYYQEQCMKIGDDLYFLNYIRYRWKGDFDGETCHTLTKFNTKTYEFQDIEINNKPSKFARFEDYLYITYPYRKSAPSDLTIYNMRAGEIKNTELMSNNEYIAVDKKNKKLYSLDGVDLYQYDLPSLKFSKKATVSPADEDRYIAPVVFVK